MSPRETRWEGSRGFLPAMALAHAIVTRPTSQLTPEEQLIGRTMGGMLRVARPVVCPPAQLDAISDDIFDDLGQAFEYAMSARLPFEVTFFDFIDASGDAPTMAWHLVEGGGSELGFELRGVLAGELATERRTVFFPIVGLRGDAPEELGAAFVDWGSEAHASATPARWQESLAVRGERDLKVTMMSISAAMEALRESPRAVPGALLGCIRAEQLGPQAEQLQASLATMTATAVRAAFKILYLLDSVNVELDPLKVSRQVRRQVERSGGQIAWTIAVRAPHRQEAEDREGGSREYSHRFEVRGIFAHYPEGSWLYEHSEPGEIRPCPRCGHCRRVWRPPHVKGPPDRPLAIKIRRVDFNHGERSP
jgi:hypothetical protein